MIVSEQLHCERDAVQLHHNLADVGTKNLSYQQVVIASRRSSAAWQSPYY